MNQKALRITQTAALTALLIALQALTRPAGQLVTGSCVNAVLALSVLLAGIWSGAAVALLSPLFAFLLGIGPQLLPIIPAIAAGNLVYTALLWALVRRRKGAPPSRQIPAWLLSALGKSAALYLIVVQVLCRVLPLKQPQIDTFSAMFSWPQLVTALIGGAIALVLAPLLERAVRRR